MHILENVEPEIAEQLRKLTVARCREVLKIACGFVALKITLDAELSSFTELCLVKDALTHDQRCFLEIYADSADQIYFEIQEKGAAEAEWLWFQKARFATALTATFDGATWDQIAEGIYELTVIFEDSSVVDFLKQSLQEVQA